MNLALSINRISCAIHTTHSDVEVMETHFFSSTIACTVFSIGVFPSTR
jgi:hypothetical protein